MEAHSCVEGEEQRAGADDLWSQTCRWDAQFAGSAARRPRDDLHATVKDVTKLQQLEQAATEVVRRKEKSTTSNVQCTSAVKRVPEGQQGDATIPMWQPNPPDVADGEQQTRVNCVEQSVVPGVEPGEHRVRQSVHIEVERVRCRDSGDCDGCSEAQDGAATRSHTEGCR